MMQEKEEMKKIGRARVILSQVVACSALNLLLVDLGMSVSFVTTVMPVLLDAKEGLSLDQYQASWFGSIVFLCQPLGSVFSGPLLDCVGRKKALFLVNIPHIVAWIMMHYAWNVPVLFAANALLGFGTGIMEAPSVTYVGEISDPSVRGVLTTLTCTFTSVGVFSAFLLGSLLPWRRAALCCLAVPLTTAMMVLLVPETPIWLLSKGRREEALKSLRYLRGWASEKHVAKEFQELERYSEGGRQCIVCASTNKTMTLPKCKHLEQCFITRAILKFRYVMFSKETFRPFQLVMGYFIVNSVCGLGPIRSNMMNVARAYGMTDDPKNIIIIVGILSIVMTVLSASVIMLIGKRVLVLSTTVGCTCCVIALAVYAKLYLPSEVFSYKAETFPLEKSYTPLVIFYLLVCFAQLGIPWVLLSEVFPFRSRGTATGLAAASSYFVSFLASKTNLEIESYLHLSGAFGLYALFGIFGTVYLYFYLPETERKSLEEIEQLYSGKRKIFADDPFINIFRRKRNEVLEDQIKERAKDGEELLPVVE